MQSHEKDRKMQFAIERRLEETRVSGGVRPWSPPLQPRAVVRAGLGPMLVKFAANPGGGTMPEPLGIFAGAARAGEPDRLPTPRLLSMRPSSPPLLHSPDERSNDTLLGALAALGPVFWAAHALLVWLKLA